MSNKQKVTGNGKKLTSNEQNVNEQRATSKRFSAFAFFIWIVFFNIFINIIHIFRVFNKSFKLVFSRLLINNWYFASYETLAYKWILSIAGWWLIRLNNELDFPNPESPIINSMDNQEFEANLGYVLLCFLL